MVAWEATNAGCSINRLQESYSGYKKSVRAAELSSHMNCIDSGLTDTQMKIKLGIQTRVNFVDRILMHQGEVKRSC